MPTDLTDPLALFGAAVDALNRERWADAAALCDPASLTAFARQLHGAFAPVPPEHKVTAESYLAHEPGMPRAVAEYYAARANAQQDPANRLHEEFAGVADVDALRALGPAETFAAWLDGHSRRRQYERHVAAGRASRAAADRALAYTRDAGWDAYRYAALGVVADGERIAHVLYGRDRGDFADPAAWTGAAAAHFAALPPEEQALTRDLVGRERPGVFTCRRQPDGTWRALAGYDFLGVTNMGFMLPDDPPAPGDGPPSGAAAPGGGAVDADTPT
jgi:hypothetical protein